MKQKESTLGRLSKAEMEVMKVIWELSLPITVPRVLEVFAKKRGWKACTLSTVMERLMEKGFLTIVKHGKPNIYETVLSFEEYKNHETSSFLLSVHNGSVRSFMSALSDGVGISAEELAEIRQWFKREKEDGL